MLEEKQDVFNKSIDIKLKTRFYIFLYKILQKTKTKNKTKIICNINMKWFII